MPNAPLLLNDDGTASVATFLLMSHHALRRDLARFARVLVGPAGSAAALASPAAQALGEEWQKYRATLHGHHQAEDAGLFPHLLSQHAELGPVVERLMAEHHRIDPLLERGDQAFATLASSTLAAGAVVGELSKLLHDHLAFEEEHVVPFMRSLKGFPPPASDAEVQVFAEGFAWSSEGIAADVLAQVDAVLPAVLTAKLAGARAAFQARSLRVWGPTPAGTSRTAVPDGMPSAV
jgi:hypothetical protein